jgi:hypothetical protein
VTDLPADEGRSRHTWLNAWTGDIPPHSYALLRIALGFLALASVLGLTPVDMFWSLDGLAPLSSDGTGPRAWLQLHGFGAVGGWLFFVSMVTVCVAMMVGFRSNAAVLCTFIGLVLQVRWNRYPLSSAHQVMIVLTFCLAWAETGLAWSVDAYLNGAKGSTRDARVPAWPLMLMRCQIALIYVSTALYKLAYPVWRDGSGVYWALSLNGFHRFPWPLPADAAPFIALMTWGTVLFELCFPVLVFFKRTRYPVLLAGVALHLGLWATLELGPFSWNMIASYIAFLDPSSTRSIVQRLLPRRPPAARKSATETAREIDHPASGPQSAHGQ